MRKALRKTVVPILVVLVFQAIGSTAEASDVSDLLDVLLQQQRSIQDYDFVISQSLFFQALSGEQIDAMLQKHKEQPISQDQNALDQIKQKSVADTIVALSQSRSKFTGGIFQSRGIGLTANSYFLHTMGDPRDEQMADAMISNAKGENDPELLDYPEPNLKFGQYLLHLPGIAFSINSIAIRRLSTDPAVSSLGSRKESSSPLFSIPPGSTVTVEDAPGTATYRYSSFPFWHEEVLRYATVKNTRIVNESEDEIELETVVKDSPRKLSYTLYCNKNGRVRKWIKKSDGITISVGDYLQFVELTPEGIEIPQAGRMWIAASGLGTSSPMPEWTRICSVLNGSVNNGLTPDDLAIDIPPGCTIDDRRDGRAINTKLVTEKAIRLGSDFPQNVTEVNR